MESKMMEQNRQDHKKVNRLVKREQAHIEFMKYLADEISAIKGNITKWEFVDGDWYAK